MAIYESRDQYSGVNEVKTGASEILLVSHKLFEMDGHFETLSEIPWKVVVVDEHHKLKNPKAKIAVNMRKLRDSHKVPVIGLTGTVMQNNHKGEVEMEVACGMLFGNALTTDIYGQSCTV